MPPIRALIVDDEPLARRRLRQLLADEPDVVVAGEAATGPEAVRQIRAAAPSLVLLDLRIPELDGFGVVEQLGARCPPVIFVTAYDRHAVRAFDLQALDYVLKPFDPERFRRAIARARRALSGPPPAPTAPTGHQLTVPLAGRALVLRIDEIDWIASAGNYAELHVCGAGHLVHQTMAALAARLAPHDFLRIHRSTIVNAERVREIATPPGGDWRVVLRSGESLAVGRIYRGDVERRFPVLR